jgi:RNA polymerase sigma-70 factor (ECF subfamily)
MGHYSSISPEELAHLCAVSGDVEAWDEFVRRFHRLIAAVVLRTARHWGEPTPQLLDDLIQETYLKLCADNCRMLLRFENRHSDSFFGFLKIVSANVVRDYFRATSATKRGAGQATESLDDVRLAPMTENSQSSSEIERQVLLNQIEHHLDQCAPGPDQQRNRMIFWLYYRQGLTASDIALLPGVGMSTKGVESTLLRLARLVRNQIVRNPEQVAPKKSGGEGLRPAESL